MAVALFAVFLLRTRNANGRVILNCALIRIAREWVEQIMIQKRLRKGVLDRLLLARSILSPSRTNVQSNDGHRIARSVLAAHDASDLAFAAMADQIGKLPARNHTPEMMA